MTLVAGAARPRPRERGARAPVAMFELALVIVLLAALALLVNLPHVLHGGFYGDDWGNQYRYDAARLVPGSAFWTSVRGQFITLGGRPLQAIALQLTHMLFGLHLHAYALLGVALSVITCALFFLLLRAVSVPAVPAAAISALALIFPWSDSSRLWSTESTASLATSLALIGVLVGLAGVRSRGVRAMALHALAVVSYVASVLTYESCAGPLLLTGILYRTRAPWSRVWKLWVIDAAAVLAALVWSYERTRSRRPVASLSAAIGDLGTYVRQSVTLVGRALVGLPLPGAVIAVGAVALLVGALAAWRRPRTRPWLGLAAGSAVAGSAAYAPWLGSGLHPLDLGEYNRVNLVAALPIAAFVVALVLAATRADTRRAPHSVLAACALALIGAGYVLRSRSDIGRWDEASSRQAQALTGARQALPAPPRGSVVYAFGIPATTGSGIFVFSSYSDLNAAVNVTIWRGRGVAAVPVNGVTTIVCGRHELWPSAPANVDASNGEGFGPAQGAPYGRAVFVDLPARRSIRVDDRASCARSSADLAGAAR